MPAYQKARFGFARHIGISITSGGIGKTELSTKETTASAFGAHGFAASSSTQS